MKIKELKALLRGKDDEMTIEIETFGGGNITDFSVEEDEGYGVLVFKEF